MLPLRARAVYIKQEATDDPRSMARAARLLPHIHCDAPAQVVDDAALRRVVVDAGLNRLPRHGTRADDIEPVVILNQYLHHHTPEQRARRQAEYPELFGGQHAHYGGYGGFDWRPSGDPAYRAKTGLVCQPAYAIHSFWGCHFRCAYCGLGSVANVYLNLKDWVDHIRAGLADLAQSPDQTLFQWDNGTDNVCWEPEYGGTKLLVELFADTPDKHLLLYVGKSANVDFMLDYEHRGHTICCWSLGPESQCRRIEKRTSSLEARLAAARKCGDAGYGIRMRYSPMVPVVDWEEELRDLVRRTFDACDPQVITIEPLRFYDYAQLERDFDLAGLDPEFVEAMRTMPDDVDAWQKTQFTDAHRTRMIRVVLDEVERVSPQTPVALCREQRRVWDALADDFARMGQDPDDYVCNCGPTSVDDPRLATPEAT